MPALPQAEPPLLYACIWILISAVILGLLTGLTGRALPDGLTAAALAVAALIPVVHISWRRRHR